MATFRDHYRALTAATPGLQEMMLESIASQNAQAYRERQLQEANVQLANLDRLISEMRFAQHQQSSREYQETVDDFQQSWRATANNRWAR